MFLARIRVPAEFAGIIMVVAAPLVVIGLLYGILDPVKNFFLRNLSEEEKKKHIFGKVVNIIVLIAALAVILLFSLPAFGITPLGNPFNV
ncbi:MAG: hypothetical protein ACK5LC_03860 [Coprobacillaceae bacterium]